MLRQRAGALLRTARPLVDGTTALLRVVPATSVPLTVAMLATAVVLGAAPLGVAVLSGVLVDRLPQVVAGSVPAGTVAVILAIPVLLVVQDAARAALGVVGGSLGRRVDGVLRDRVLGISLDPVGVAHLEDPELRDVFGAARNLSPFSMSPGDGAAQLGWMLSFRLQGLFAVAVLAWHLPLLAAVVLPVWVVVQLLAVSSVVRLVTASAFGMLTPDVVYLRELGLTAPAAKEVRVFGLGPWLTGRFTAIASGKLDAAIAARRGQLGSFASVGLTLGLGLAGALAWTGTADLAFGDATVVVLSLLTLFAVPNTWPDVPVVYGTLAIAAVERAEAIVAAALDVPASPLPPGGPATAIALQGVRFRYPRTGHDVLTGLDLVVPAGQRLAVVGLNGSGKTTLVKLLCRLYDPDEGAVVVDGIDIRRFDPVDWRSRLGVLFQDFLRWELPASDNVALAFPGTTAPIDALDRAAALAGVGGLVASLPLGWATPLSAGVDGGVDLSGGQWQRVALARALHAVDQGARLLVLDEPTANLDPRGEQEFFDAVLRNPVLRTAADGTPVTTILISHRFATVRHADRIVVLGDGRVVEDGTHADLLAAGGRYAELFEAQAQAFRETT